MRVPVIVVRRIYFDQFRSGAKTVEYRRHRRPLTIKVFYPGRRVTIACGYTKGRLTLHATVRRFEVKPLRQVPEMAGFYADLGPEDELALIHLTIESRPTGV